MYFKNKNPFYDLCKKARGKPYRAHSKAGGVAGEELNVNKSVPKKNNGLKGKEATGIETDTRQKCYFRGLATA